VQAGRSGVKRFARFMNRDARQLSFYSAVAFLCFAGRLTAFRRTRNIVRIRTKFPVVDHAKFSVPADRAIGHRYQFGRSTV
jgi:hypothetical protein